MINFSIDFVFPYVNNNVEQWREEYKQYCISHNLKDRLGNLDNERYRDLGLLKYVFRSIDKFAPWIHNIYLIVSDITQVPDWINKDKVNIVVHKDIIPQAYLPTYNSTTIEMFIHNIPNLSEHFIYSNDDIYFTNYTSPEEFFTQEGFPKIDILNDILKTPTAQFYQVCYNCYKDLSSTLHKPLRDLRYVRPEHGMSPILLRHCKETYSLLQPNILKKISNFRTSENYNQYIYTDYAYLKNEYKRSTRTFNYIALKKNLNEIIDLITQQSQQMLCLNDTAHTDKELWLNNIDKVYQAFNDIGLSNKSRFEI